MAVWSKAQVYERSLVGMAGSNPAGGINVSRMSVGGFCDEPISCPGESYRMSMSVMGRNNNPLRLQWVGKRGEKKTRKCHIIHKIGLDQNF